MSEYLPNLETPTFSALNTCHIHEEQYVCGLDNVRHNSAKVSTLSDENLPRITTLGFSSLKLPYIWHEVKVTDRAVTGQILMSAIVIQRFTFAVWWWWWLFSSHTRIFLFFFGGGGGGGGGETTFSLPALFFFFLGGENFAGTGSSLLASSHN